MTSGAAAADPGAPMRSSPILLTAIARGEPSAHTATSMLTQLKTRVTPKSHANMPAPAGSSYARALAGGSGPTNECRRQPMVIA